jgi:hypothetical protein
MCVSKALNIYNTAGWNGVASVVYAKSCCAVAPPCVVLCCAVLAVVPVSGTMREASSAGFRKIANFIFGKRQVILSGCVS